MGVCYMRRSGFTMIEMFIVLAIIAVLTAVLLPISLNVLNQAKVTDVLNYIRELYIVELEYYVRKGETTDLEGLAIFIPSDWVEENEDLFTDWATSTRSVSFTVNFNNNTEARALLAMYEDTPVSSAIYYSDDNDEDVRIYFEF